MLEKTKTLKRFTAEITAAVVFVIYLFTLAPSVVQIDAGELSAVQKILGVAHPTGYPLFSIIGYLFLKIPLSFSDIYKANLLAAIWCALGVFLFIKAAQILLLNIPVKIFEKKSKAKKAVAIPQQRTEFNKTILPSVLGGLSLAFSKTYWIQSTSTEVYSLQIFLFILIIHTSLKAFFSTKENKFSWNWVALTLALGFANHMTTLLVLPFVTVLFFSKEKFNYEAGKKIIVMLSIFFPLLILFYLYLPLRATANPQINWGNVINIENFWWHFTGRQYQVWLFASFNSAGKQLLYYFQSLPMEFFILNLLVALIGMVASFRLSKTYFYCLFSTFIFSVFYSINYDIVDIDSYFLLSFIMLSFFTVFGFYRISAQNSKGYFSPLFYVLFSVLICIHVWTNYSKIDQSYNYTFEDYTLSILNNSDPNSIIFSYQWDYFVSPSYYFQYAEGIRKDIAVIDKELLRRSWYYNQLKRNHPGVIKNIEPEIQTFLTSLQPFERNEKFDPNLLEKNYRTIMTKLVSENCNTRSFYVGLELIQKEIQNGEFPLPPGYQLVPDLLMFKVVKGNEYVAAKDPNFRIRFTKNRNNYTDNIKNFVCTVLLYRANYELFFNKQDRAKLYIDKLKSDFPEFKIPGEILERIK